MTSPATQLQRPCPVCEHPEASSWLSKRELHLVRCPQCSMVFANPLPAESAPEHYDALGRPYYLSKDKLEGDFASVRFQRELQLFRRFCPRGSVLDVGCSTGAFLFQLHNRFPDGYTSAGIDVSVAALDYARSRGLDVIDASLLTHDFKDQSFDAVTFWAVLEHLAEPARFLERASDQLKSGGHLFALVPNLQSLAVRLLRQRYRYILPQHVNYFSAATLHRLIINAGLKPVAHGGSHFNPMVLWQDATRGSDAGVADADRAALLVRTTRLKQSRWLIPARWALGATESMLARLGLADNLWVVARKP